MSDFFMEASLVLGVAGIGLTTILFAIYRRVYRQTKAPFGLALLLFAGAFLAQNVLIVYSYLATMPLIPDSLTPFLFGVGLCETTGLGAVLWTASR